MKVDRIVGQTTGTPMADILAYRQGFYERWYDVRVLLRRGVSVQETADCVLEELSRGDEFVSTRAPQDAVCKCVSAILKTVFFFFAVSMVILELWHVVVLSQLSHQCEVFRLGINCGVARSSSPLIQRYAGDTVQVITARLSALDKICQKNNFFGIQLDVVYIEAFSVPHPPPTLPLQFAQCMSRIPLRRFKVEKNLNALSIVCFPMLGM